MKNDEKQNFISKENFVKPTLVVSRLEEVVSMFVDSSSPYNMGWFDEEVE